ncbi:hypothetical protein HMPREF3192_00456 [Atopobium deltae]|uniref:Uncharacterized protein n=1 Tax=Atopobium deltae TaxID=1393034 RepID=A0A133XVY5_9ACTN|nr:hypothetical protein HMPREF3192_00456 [Atopobium deltae]
MKSLLFDLELLDSNPNLLTKQQVVEKSSFYKNPYEKQCSPNARPREHHNLHDLWTLS